MAVMAALIPIALGALGGVLVYLKRSRDVRDARKRSSASRSEIEHILLQAKIREAKAREAEGQGSNGATSSYS
jgi:hypothetical protein